MLVHQRIVLHVVRTRGLIKHLTTEQNMFTIRAGFAITWRSHNTWFLNGRRCKVIHTLPLVLDGERVTSGTHESRVASSRLKCARCFKMNTLAKRLDLDQDILNVFCLTRRADVQLQDRQPQNRAAAR